MTGQYQLTEEEEEEIKNILTKHNIDWNYDETHIHISEFEWGVSGKEPDMKVNIYIQVE